jgi:hypothetical protein
MTKTEYFKNKPAQKIIYDFLCHQKNGSLGAVRTNQRARGFEDERQCSGSNVLEPLYALVEAGFVTTTREKTPRGQYVTRYFAVI